MRIRLLFDECIKELDINPVSCAQHGDVLYLADPQHIDYYNKIKFNATNDCHNRYLKRGLLFEDKADALLFAKSFIREGGEVFE